jgi:FKBP-type peptidyl-prolyl cis-trans isomerase SlpA
MRGRAGPSHPSHTRPVPARTAPPYQLQHLVNTTAPASVEATTGTVQAGSFLTLHYRLAGPGGVDVVNTFNDKPATLSLGMGQLAPAIEAQLLGLHEGAHQTFDLPAGAAFGQRSPDMLQRVKLSLLHELGDATAEYAVGDAVQFPTPDGQSSYAGVVREVGSDWLLFDFNHPLAGQAVRFEVKLLGVL